MRAVVLAALALLLAVVGGAHAQEGGDHGAAAGDAAAFERATAHLAAGDPGRAAAALVELAERAPESPQADDALFLAAELHEDELGDPGRALALYRQLLARYPDSRVALAASRRAEALAGAIEPGGEGDQALARWRALLAGFADRGADAAIRDAEALLRDYPDWAGRPRVHLWLGQVHQREGRLGAAARELAAARAGDDADVAFEATLAAVEVALLARDFAAADRILEEASASDPPRLRALEDARARVDLARARLRAARASLVGLAGIALLLAASLWRSAGGARPALRALRRPPVEAIYMAPLALLIFLLALTDHESAAPTVGLICGGGLALTWLSGAGLRAARDAPVRPRRWLALAHAVLTASGIAALVYLALYRNDLLDLVTSTLRFGPDL